MFAGYNVTVVDNLINSSEESLKRVRVITSCEEKRITFVKVDMCDLAAFERVFESSPPFLACIHFAGLKAVGESVRLPLLYYQNNLLSTINLLNLMDKYGCRTIVFSSSATVGMAYLLRWFYQSLSNLHYCRYMALLLSLSLSRLLRDKVLLTRMEGRNS